MIFVTGWNEWTAGCYSEPNDAFMAGKPAPKGSALFIDEYNEEFSRDIEPEDGKLQDNYYYQLADFVRRYKGVRPVQAVTPKAITVSHDFAQWRSVSPEFRSEASAAMHRAHVGFGGNGQYVNATGRNTITTAKVTYDARNVYFYARTAEKLTPPTGGDWMLLFINSDANAATGWLGYDFVVNRTVGTRTTSLEHNQGGDFDWTTQANVSYAVHGNELMVAIPRKALGLTSLPATIHFKWADNCLSSQPSAMDFTINGDAAPEGRFNFKAVLMQKAVQAKAQKAAHKASL